MESTSINLHGTATCAQYHVIEEEEKRQRNQIK